MHINCIQYSRRSCNKGYFGCRCCGPSLKARCSKDLRKPMYDFSRIFLPEQHPYRRAASTFNGKRERTQRPPIMTPAEWLRAYEREKEKEFTEMFDSNGEPKFDDPDFFNTYVEEFPIGMKRKSIFYDLPYWEHLNIAHLLDPMHIFKMFLLLYGGTYHRNKVTHWWLGKILLLQKLKRNIGQDD